MITTCMSFMAGTAYNWTNNYKRNYWLHYIQ